MALSGGLSRRHLATAVFVEEVDNLFDNFNGGTSVSLEKTLCDDSPHIDHWTKTSMKVSSWVLLKDGKISLSLTPSFTI
jgi:hypothetical protein